jgi:hypothetical protein
MVSSDIMFLPSHLPIVSAFASMTNSTLTTTPIEFGSSPRLYG